MKHCTHSSPLPKTAVSTKRRKSFPLPPLPWWSRWILWKKHRCPSLRADEPRYPPHTGRRIFFERCQNHPPVHKKIHRACADRRGTNPSSADMWCAEGGLCPSCGPPPHWQGRKEPARIGETPRGHCGSPGEIRRRNSWNFRKGHERHRQVQQKIVIHRDANGAHIFP